MKRTLGIMGAMAEEIDVVKTMLKDAKCVAVGGRSFHTGTINNVDCVVVFSKWGKVAASITASILIGRFAISELVFVGTAGALAEGLKIGDIVIAERLVQHDLDARPMIPRFELPLLNRVYVDSDRRLTQIAICAVSNILKRGVGRVMGEKNASDFNIDTPRLILGDIASGDQFVNSVAKRESILEELPDVQCVEMEGAAVAQVCYEFNLPFAVIRVISDTADHNARVDFTRFVMEVANAYAKAIIDEMTRLLF